MPVRFVHKKRSKMAGITSRMALGQNEMDEADSEC